MPFRLSASDLGCIMKMSCDCIKVNTYIFTEGGSKIGLGHLTRCVALYDELESRNIKAILVIYGDDSVKPVIGERKYILDNWHNDWSKYLNEDCNKKTNCIIDSYLASEKTYYEIQKYCRKALYIDDTNRINYPRGIIVNPSIYVNRSHDLLQQDRIRLTGIDYVILRKEFQTGFHREVRERIGDIIVILGGSDVRNLTPHIISVLGDEKYNRIIKHIVIGNAFNNIPELKQLSKAYQNVHLHINLNSNELYNLMAKSDFAVTAAGQTVYELIAMKLPFICIKVMNNQENNITGLIQHGIIEYYLDYDRITDSDSLKICLRENIEKFLPMAVRENQVNNMAKINIGKGARHIIDALVGEHGIRD